MRFGMTQQLPQRRFGCIVRHQQIRTISARDPCHQSVGKLASSLISDYGYDYDLIYVYEGGMEEWEAAGHPVEIP